MKSLVFAAGIILLATILAIAFPRYRVIPTSNGLIVRVDRWTGESDACAPSKDTLCFVPKAAEQSVAYQPDPSEPLYNPEQCAEMEKADRGLPWNCFVMPPGGWKKGSGK